MRGELAGGVAVIDVRTGRILGLYSKPGYNPNALSGGSGKQVIRDAFRRLYSDPLKPALDKTLSGAYPPGSTFKPFTALAALEKGLIDPRQSSRCRGALDVRQARLPVHARARARSRSAARRSRESCNVYFYRLAAEYGVGMDVIAEMGQRYGLGARTGLGINAEAGGRMPTRAWMTLRNEGQFRLGFGLNAAIGQGATTVTVLQLALAYAALANGGTLYQPQIVRAVETSAGTVVQEFTPRVRAPDRHPAGEPLARAAGDGHRRERGGRHGVQGARRGRGDGGQDGDRAGLAPARRAASRPSGSGTSTASTPGSPATRRRARPRSPSSCSSSTAARAASTPRRSPSRSSARTRSSRRSVAAARTRGRERARAARAARPPRQGARHDPG